MWPFRDKTWENEAASLGFWWNPKSFLSRTAGIPRVSTAVETDVVKHSPLRQGWVKAVNRLLPVLCDDRKLGFHCSLS